MTMDKFVETLGFVAERSDEITQKSREATVKYIGLKLIANGQPVPAGCGIADSLGAERILNTYYQRLKQLDAVRSPADRRIESFLETYFAGVNGQEDLRLPDSTFVLDRHGIARELSLPIDGDTYSNELVSSYRVHNGVLHNPRNDRRTTKGTFHVTEGGLPIPNDKLAVPRETFAKLFHAAMNPPDVDLEFPFCANEVKKSSGFVSLLLRPIVCPEVGGYCEEKTMEVRFFAPGSLVANLDFVE